VLNAGQRAKALVERILGSAARAWRARAGDVQSLVPRRWTCCCRRCRGVSRSRDARGGDTAVIGDATQIHQVVMNLCTNAMQGDADGGALEVALKLHRCDTTVTLTTGALPAGDYVCLMVRDHGHGIEPEAVHRIFDPFFTTKRVGVGTGLGLRWCTASSPTWVAPLTW